MPANKSKSAKNSNYFETCFSDLFQRVHEYEGLEKLADSDYWIGPKIEMGLLIAVNAGGQNGLKTTYSELVDKIDKNYASARDVWREGKRANPIYDPRGTQYTDPIIQLNYTLEKLGIEKRLTPDYDKDFFIQYDRTRREIMPQIDKRLDALARKNDNESHVALANAIASLYIASRKIAHLYGTKPK